MKLSATLTAAVATAVLVAASPALAAPFGIAMGTPQSQLNILRNVDETTAVKTYEISVPQPNSEISFYDVDLTAKTGVCRLIAFGTSHPGDDTGALVRSVYSSFKTALDGKYGKDEEFDYLNDGSKLTGPSQFAQGLNDNERSLVTYWDSSTKAGLPSDIQAISLEAEAVDGDSTYIVVTYEFSNYNDCAAQKPRDTSSDSKGL